MQEEIERKTVCLVIKGAKLTTELFASGIKKAFETGLNVTHKEHEKHGEMKLEDLVGKGRGAKSVDVKEGDLGSFRKIASKYNVDYSIKQGKDENGKNIFYVFFQAKDESVIQSALKEFVKKNETKEIKKSLRQELKQNKEKAAAERSKKSRERNTQKRRTRELNR